MINCKNILIIDDDADIRETLKEALEFEGYNASTANNGSHALEYLQSSAELPGLIILDLMMPVMDGIQFLNIVHKEFKDTIAKIPLILATAKGSASGSPHSHLAHENLRKPVDLDELYAMIERYCGKA